MKWTLLFAICVLTNQQAVACHCSPLKTLDAGIFQQYKHVALVRIVSIEPVAIEFPERKFRGAQFRVEAIENFKDKLPDTILLDGYRTSCDMGLLPGEEWLIFTREVNGHATVFPCDYSFEYKSKDGLKDFRYHADDQFLNRIRTMVGRSVSVKNGLVEEFYLNGQKAYTETYSKGKLEGNRFIWHSNGTLWAQEFYVNGQKEGAASWWYADGTLETKETFDKGTLVDTGWYWYEIKTDSLDLKMHSLLGQMSFDSAQQVYGRRQLLNVTVYGQGGQRLYSKSYNRDGSLIYENILDMDISALAYTMSLENKRELPSINLVNSKTGSPVYRLSFNKDGSQQATYYDTKGRLLRQTLIKGELETIVEQKHYPY